jgi:hypothetical protein
MTRELILTIEEGYIQDQELLEDVLFEKAKEYLENEYIELVEFEELKQTEQANLYRITAEDVYYDDEYTYKGDVKDMIKEFTGKDTKEVLDLINDTKTK